MVISHIQLTDENCPSRNSSTHLRVPASVATIFPQMTLRLAPFFLVGLQIALLPVLSVTGQEQAASAKQSPPRTAPAHKTIHDLLWVWGNPEMTKPGDHTVATFAEASPVQRAQLLGVPNILMAGHGLPNDNADSERLTRTVARASRLVWEIGADETSAEPRGFAYERRIAQARRLAQKYPQLEGVLLDDLSSLGIDCGFKPEHIRHVRELLGDTHDRVKVWGVIYTMNLDRGNITDYFRELDVINLWIWHAKDIPMLEAWPG